MTDEGEPPVADLAAEILSGDRPSTPGNDGPGNKTLGRYLAWAFIVVTVVYVLGMSVVVLAHRD